MAFEQSRDLRSQGSASKAVITSAQTQNTHMEGAGTSADAAATQLATCRAEAGRGASIWGHGINNLLKWVTPRRWSHPENL